MPDVHLGIGATIGSVIPTLKAIIPAAVGVDIGCGMMACKTTLRAETCPTTWPRCARRSSAPCRTARRRAPGPRRQLGEPAGEVDQVWAGLADEFELLCELHPRLKNTNNRKHLGTLGTGNHFIEVCLDEDGFVWFMLHSGSRGVGNAIGTHFIELAKKDAERHQRNLPDKDLAYFEEGAQYFGDYVRGGGLGAEVRGAEPRGDDGQPDRHGARR
jgi:tRNA-splicing ligase RtcB